MTPVGASRRTGLLLVALLLTSGVTRGLCFMPGAGEAGTRGAHDCCKTGWTALPPECCMAGAADETPARVVGLATVLPVLFPTGTTLHPPLDVSRAPEAITPVDRTHSPPGRSVLRI